MEYGPLPRHAPLQTTHTHAHTNTFTKAVRARLPDPAAFSPSRTEPRGSRPPAGWASPLNGPSLLRESRPLPQSQNGRGPSLLRGEGEEEAQDGRREGTARGASVGIDLCPLDAGSVPHWLHLVRAVAGLPNGKRALP